MGSPMEARAAFRVSRTELGRIHALAQLRGVSPSAWLREAAATEADRQAGEILDRPGDGPRRGSTPASETGAG